jgi:hypothetical protein
VDFRTFVFGVLRLHGQKGKGQHWSFGAFCGGGLRIFVSADNQPVNDKYIFEEFLTVKK